MNMNVRSFVAVLASVSMLATTSFADPGRGGDDRRPPQGQGPGPGPDRGGPHQHPNNGGCDTACQNTNLGIAAAGVLALLGIAAADNNAANSAAQTQELKSEAAGFQVAYQAAEQLGSQESMDLSPYSNLVAAASSAGVNTSDTTALYDYAYNLSN